MRQKGIKSFLKLIMPFFLIMATAMPLSLSAQWRASNERRHTRPLQVRLIQVLESSNDNEINDQRLRGLLPLLQRNLRYQNYRLVAQRSFIPQSEQREKIGLGFIVSIENVQGSVMTIRLHHQRIDRPRQEARELLQTRLRLQPERPVIIGPFRDHQGLEYIIVFTVA